MSMHRTAKTYLILLTLGLVAGTLGGLFGIGGGALIVPGLVFFLAFPQHRAHGTSLVSALVIGIAGVGAYYAADSIDFVLAAEIAAGAVIGAIFGGRLAGRLRGKTLRRVFGGFLVLVAVWMVYTGITGAVTSDADVQHLAGYQAALAIVGTGLLTGFMSALLGIGGGIVMIPAMVILLGVPQRLAQGISLATIIPTAFVGILIHRRMGNVDLKVGALVSAGAVLGIQIGSAIAIALKSDALTISFGVFLAVIAGLMMLKSRR